MKKIKYIIVTFLCGILLVSCNDELDAAFEEAGEAIPVLNDITYELTSADFAAFDAGDDDIYEVFNAFPSIEDAEIKIAPILSDKTDVAVNGLNMFVDVKYNTGLNTNDEDLSSIVTARKYELESSDYLTQGAGAFLQTDNEEDALKEIVEREILTPQENDVVRVEYLKFTEAPVDGTTVISETNFGAFEGWTPVNITGEQEWSEGVQFNNVQMSGFNGSPVENEDWLVSPELDFSDAANLKIQINQTFRFGNPDNLGLQVLIATDYTGDVESANWEEVTFTNVPTNDNDEYVLSEDVDISQFDGETVNLALKYESTNSASTRWRVRQINVKAGGLEGAKEQLFTFFKYNGTEWELLESDNVYVLKDADYDEMGAPGRFNNFSSSVLPENYLPAFVSKQFPFGQEEDNILIVYDFFFGGDTRTLTTATQYVFANSSWSAPAATLKFTYKDGRWEPNNAIPYELIEADYDLVVTELANEEGLDDEISNLDRFGNFNRREGGSTFWDNDELLQALNVVLKANFPNTEVGKRYEVTISAFPTGTETYLLELAESGNYIYVE